MPRDLQWTTDVAVDTEIIRVRRRPQQIRRNARGSGGKLHRRGNFGPRGDVSCLSGGIDWLQTSTYPLGLRENNAYLNEIELFLPVTEQICATGPPERVPCCTGAQIKGARGHQECRAAAPPRNSTKPNFGDGGVFGQDFVCHTKPNTELIL